MSDEARSLPTAAEFDAVMATYLRSDTLRRAAADAYGAEYPAEIDPFSGVTLSLLAEMADSLGVGPGQEFLDMACGAGGPGLWLARRTGAAVVGVDFSKVALSAAGQRAAGFV